MKKVLVGVLMVILTLCTLVGCTIKPVNPGGNSGSTNGDLDQAKAALNTMYYGETTTIVGDFERISQVNVKGTIYPITWTTDATEGVVINEVNEKGMVVIGITQSKEHDINFNLIATITDEESGESVSVTYSFTIARWKENTFAEYLAAAAGDPVVVKGIVSGIMSTQLGDSYNGIYFDDGIGGYYAYDCEDPIEKGVEVGMEIRVSGLKDIYSGTHEIKDGVVEILNSEKKELAPVDFTELYANAEDIKAAALVEPQALLVTIKGVTIGGQDTSNGYYYFSLGGLESYVRISGSMCPLNAADTAAFKEFHSEHFGYTADVTGVICVFSGAFYLTPVTADAFTNVQLPDLDDAAAVAFVKENLSIPAKVTDATAIEVPAADKTYSKVQLAWSLDNEYAFASITDEVLNITLPEEATTITLNVTLTAGEVTDTASFEILVSANRIDWRSATFAVELANTLDAASKEMTEDYYYFFGQVADVPTETYCNFNLSDGTNSILVYGLYAPNGEDRYGTKREIAEIPFTQGDYVFLRAKVQNYNGTLELAQAQLISVGLDAAKAIELCGQLDGANKEISAEEYYIFGQVIDVPTADYCNFNFSDGTNNIVVYGLYAKNETDRYGTKRQIAEIPFTQGDWVLLKGKLQNYNGKLEVVNASLQSIGYSATSAATMAAALDGDARETSENAYYFYGTVGEIYNTGYCNFYLTDATTSNVVVYGVYAPNGEDRYGSKREIAEIPFKQGDSIILYAKVQNYNGTLELVSAVLVSYIPAKGGVEPPVEIQEPDVIENVTVTDLIAVESDKEMKQAYTVTGTVSAWRYDNSTDGGEYGNFYLSDGTNQILVYGATVTESALVWNATAGTYSFSNPKDYLTNATTSAIAIGDTVTLKVVRSSFNGTPQLNAIVVSVGGGNQGGEQPPVVEPPVENEEPAVIENVTVAQLNAVSADLEMKQTYTVTGTVKAWNKASASEYGDFILSDASGEILVYGATSTASALVWNATSGTYSFSNPKDFLKNDATKNIKIGDVVTLKVVRTHYNSTLELYAIVISVAEHTCDANTVLEAVEATCTEAGYTAGTACSVCGAVQSGHEVVEATGHNYVNGACTACGAQEDAVGETVVLTFPAASQDKANAYNKDWTATVGENKWAFTGFNNYDNGWDHIRAGWKTEATTPTITTTTAIVGTVTSIKLTLTMVDMNQVTSAKLLVSATADFANATEYDLGTLTTGVNTITISEGIANGYYKLVFECTKATSSQGNGKALRISQIEYVVG
ncbi:MAG: hypothetical protein IJO25_02570 [Clostridia bacterium]|nr:hypothetical protein [Clostridia bacterium]